MSTGGLSEARLGRMHDVMAGHVERGEVPGLVTLVSRRQRPDATLGVVFNALISGRRPQVSVAPVEAHVPRGWQELDDLA